MAKDIRDKEVISFRRRPRLVSDMAVDVCVIGAGLAGLTVAREAARLGASVAVVESKQVGWHASGHNLGTVMPGYNVPISELIARVGYENARELWSLAQEGANYVRTTATDNAMSDIALTEGALEVSNVDSGDRLISRLQMLSEDFGTDVEGWQVDRIRDVLKTQQYFHGIHYPRAFQIDSWRYVHSLATLAEQVGVCIFEDTPVVSIDMAGIRKHIVTSSACLRASHVVLAGSVHLGALFRRLSDTLLPVWRFAVVTMPLGEKLSEAITFQGSVSDTDGIDHYRTIDGNRLMWSGVETTWGGRPERFARKIKQQIYSIFPTLAPLEIADVFGSVFGLTIHGMPQIGELQRGVWVASGFGRQGLNTTAMAGQLIASGICLGDDRWRLFSPFELVWTGGSMGKIVGQTILSWSRRRAAAVGAVARYRERKRGRANHMADLAKK